MEAYIFVCVSEKKQKMGRKRKSVKYKDRLRERERGGKWEQEEEGEGEKGQWIEHRLALPLTHHGVRHTEAPSINPFCVGPCGGRLHTSPRSRHRSLINSPLPPPREKTTVAKCFSDPTLSDIVTMQDNNKGKKNTVHKDAKLLPANH